MVHAMIENLCQLRLLTMECVRWSDSDHLWHFKRAGFARQQMHAIRFDGITPSVSDPELAATSTRLCPDGI